MKKFEIPDFYKSGIITELKNKRKKEDPKKKDFSPSLLHFDNIFFYIPRHFGFCYGVENAIEIAYKSIKENKGKNIYLVSQMIHNPEVNNDLLRKGIKFIFDKNGKQLISWQDIKRNDIVIIPAFGTTVDIKKKLQSIGVDIKKYNTTCPFVEKVWNRAKKLGENGFTVIIHGKYKHEETKATFSHSNLFAPSLIIKDIYDAKLIGDIINGKRDSNFFYKYFKGRYSKDFDVNKDLEKIGVVNQTTMLASETMLISNYFKNLMINKYGEERYKEHFADTRDTLCYATNDNQNAIKNLLSYDADLAIVIGGFNSSNTSHIVELCLQKFPTYFISSDNDIIDKDKIKHYDYKNNKMLYSNSFLPKKKNIKIILASGASCPDALVERVMLKIIKINKTVT